LSFRHTTVFTFLVVDKLSHIETLVTLELQSCIATPAEKDIGFDVLGGWQKNHTRVPLLAQATRMALEIPATSAPSERMFFEAGLIFRAKRASLNHDNVAMLLCQRTVSHFQTTYKIEL